MKMILGGVVAFCLAIALLTVNSADAAPVTKTVASTVTVTTNASGFATVTHDLGAVPKGVLVTGKAPITGTGIPAGLMADSYTATTFRIRALNQTGQAIANAPVTISWEAFSVGAVAPPPTNEVRYTSYTTGYSWYDNTPPGAATISNPVIHQTAGGTGTFTDPITVAVGHSIINGQDILDFSAGTKFYVPNLRKYLIVEDTCGDGPTPQNGPCHNLSQADPGAQNWLDIWVDGRQSTDANTNACMDAITANHLTIKNPNSNYAVVVGPVMGTTCAQQFGDNVVTV